MDDFVLRGSVPIAFDVFERFIWQRNAPGPRDGNRFEQRRPQHGQQIGILADRPDRAAGERSHAAEHREAHELRPDVDHDVVAQRARESRVPARVEEASSIGGRSPSSGPKMSSMAVWRMTPGSAMTAATYVVLRRRAHVPRPG